MFSDVLMLRYNLLTLAHPCEISHDTYYQGFMVRLKALINHDDCYVQDLKLRVKPCVHGCLFPSVLLFCVNKVLIQINI